MANVCLALAAFVFILFSLPLFHHKIAQSNDQGATGYVIIIVAFLHLLILGCISAAYFIIGRDGYFHWVSGHALLRTLIISIGLISCLIFSALTIMNRLAAGSGPEWFREMTRIAPVLIPVIVVGTGFILNNTFLRETIPLPFYKWPWMAMSAGCLTGLILLAIQTWTTGRPGVQESTRKYEHEESIKNDRLAEIESADISKDIVRILEFTGGLYPQEVRQKAAAKILTDTAWQKNLVHLMENEHALVVFNFLQSNEVPDKKLFLQPVLSGVNSVASEIRHSIQGTNSSGFYSDMFTDEVERVLRTVEKFEGMGVDYLPAVKEMRAALDEPRMNTKVKFDCIPALDDWIKKRG
jgi:hypothetical protein